ncbi:MAG TPA: hypothetical protein VE779_09835 [Candidatus Angelobacter sp.]|nr:hypothetical protein [Candidatus Angelobacter sp.]
MKERGFAVRAKAFFRSVLKGRGFSRAETYQNLLVILSAGGASPPESKDLLLTFASYRSPVTDFSSGSTPESGAFQAR